MDDLKKMLDGIVNEVDPDDPYGRTRMEIIADKLLEDAVAGLGESRKQLRQYQAEMSPLLHSALEKKIRHAVK
jgi:hypothetical protein